ncbi:MAG: hypothetical protein B7Z44_10165 [Caulobacter sp. 12-67-6]|nr:MAG: hypothetical protein B7Z44_10165 [Caulobacter sp. 12-67-6]OYX68970.1 MAG: hypothetical protein B7Y81_15600 [Caulobacter sp. 32-67-35]OYX94510.1 MAG: hypothetical protein B7Y78_06585 [Caulobacter sp. 35-67-4]
MIVFVLLLTGGLLWDGYQIVFRRRVALPLRTFGVPFYVELAKAPKAFWLVLALHVTFWAFLISGTIRALQP